MIRASNPYEDRRNEILYQLRHYRSSVANYQACKELYESMFPSGTQMITDMPHCQSTTFEPERWAERRMNQKERMGLSLEKMREECDDILKLISLVDGDYNTVLVRRYLLNESYEIISEKMHCHRNTIKNWHDRAIRKLIEKDCTVMCI